MANGRGFVKEVVALEWGRAKTILIMAFVILNLLLVFQLSENTQDITVQNVDMEAFSDEVRALMQNKKIAIQADMPAVSGPLQQITVTYENGGVLLNKQPLSKPIEAEVPLNSTEFYNRLQMRVSGLEMSEYQYDEQMTNKNIIVYHQLYEGLPMFEVNLRLYRENGNVVAVSRDRVTIESMGEQKLISSYTAVSTLVENYLPDGAVVEQVQLGYHGQLYNSEKQFLTPFWRVILADQSKYYVHAINGAVEALQKESSQ